jgi:hypothetical protein
MADAFHFAERKVPRHGASQISALCASPSALDALLLRQFHVSQKLVEQFIISLKTRIGVLLKFIEAAADQQEVDLALAVDFGGKFGQRAIQLVALLLLAG